MCPTGIIVLFECKSCSASFQSVSSFIEHKRLNHFLEFQNTAVILFKETRIEPFGQALPPEEDRLFPTLESKSTLNSEPTVTTTNHETFGYGNKPEDCKPNIYPCIDIDIDCHSDSEAEANRRINSATSTSKKFIDNLCNFACEEKILHPPKLKHIGLNKRSHTDTTGQSSQIQKEIIIYNKNKNDNHSSSLGVQPKIATASEPFHNPYVLLKRLSSKEIQNYSSSVNTQTQQDQLLSNDPNYDIDLDQGDEPDISIFLRPKVEILEEFDDVPLADYTCKFCKGNFVSYTALQLHHQTCASFVRAPQSYCTLCNSHFPNFQALQNHNLTQHGLRGHYRDRDKNSSQIFQNGIGAGVSIQVEPYRCNVCGRWFVTESSLDNHLVTHSEERTFPCRFPGCGKVFKTVHTLGSHRSTHYKGFSCKFPDCDLSFGSQESLKEHVGTHISKFLKAKKNGK